MANAIEQALLLLADMADLRGMRNHEMFLNFKRDLALVSPSTNFLTLKVITMFSLSFFFFFPFFSSLTRYTPFLGRLSKLHIGLRR